MESVGERTYRAKESGREIFKTTPATPDDGKGPRREEVEEEVTTTTVD